MIDFIDMVVAISNGLKELGVKLGDDWEQARKIRCSDLWQWTPGYSAIICLNFMINGAALLSNDNVLLI